MTRDDIQTERERVALERERLKLEREQAQHRRDNCESLAIIISMLATGAIAIGYIILSYLIK